MMIKCKRRACLGAGIKNAILAVLFEDGVSDSSSWIMTEVVKGNLSFIPLILCLLVAFCCPSSPLSIILMLSHPDSTETMNTKGNLFQQNPPSAPRDEQTQKNNV